MLARLLIARVDDRSAGRVFELTSHAGEIFARDLIGRSGKVHLAAVIAAKLNAQPVIVVALLCDADDADERRARPRIIVGLGYMSLEGHSLARFVRREQLVVFLRSSLRSGEDFVIRMLARDRLIYIIDLPATMAADHRVWRRSAILLHLLLQLACKFLGVLRL